MTLSLFVLQEIRLHVYQASVLFLTAALEVSSWLEMKRKIPKATFVIFPVIFIIWLQSREDKKSSDSTANSITARLEGSIISYLTKKLPGPRPHY